MRLTTTVTITADTKQWKKMEKNLRRGGGGVDVGWWNTQHPSGLPTAQIAAWNEEGHMNGGIFEGTYTPPRPFIRRGFIPAAKKSITQYFPDFNKIALGKMTWGQLYSKMAKDYVKLMQETILRWDTPANSPVTVSMKGFNDPLIHTGNMYDVVKSRIVRIK